MEMDHIKIILIHLTGTDYNGNAVSESVQTTALNYTFTPKAGTYTVKVTDANGCEKTTSDAITLNSTRCAA